MVEEEEDLCLRETHEGSGKFGRLIVDFERNRCWVLRLKMAGAKAKQLLAIGKAFVAEEGIFRERKRGKGSEREDKD